MTKDPPLDAEALFRRLDTLGIAHRSHTHPPVFTVEEAKALRGTLPGAHVKNLFLRDKKKRIWLVTALEEREIDLKALKRRLGEQGSLSALARPGSPEQQDARRHDVSGIRLSLAGHGSSPAS